MLQPRNKIFFGQKARETKQGTKEARDLFFIVVKASLLMSLSNLGTFEQFKIEMHL